MYALLIFAINHVPFPLQFHFRLRLGATNSGIDTKWRWLATFLVLNPSFGLGIVAKLLCVMVLIRTPWKKENFHLVSRIFSADDPKPFLKPHFICRNLPS